MSGLWHLTLITTAAACAERGGRRDGGDAPAARLGGRRDDSRPPSTSPPSRRLALVHELDVFCVPVLGHRGGVARGAHSLSARADPDRRRPRARRAHDARGRRALCHHGGSLLAAPLL